MPDESELRRAVDRNEFLLHYQHKVDLSTGRVTAVEALIRWQHPAEGLLQPVQFIPLAEETGLIIPIGGWVLQAASGQNKAWQNQGLPPVRVTVNLSSRQFEQRDLASRIGDMLKKIGLEPKYLALELTETRMMHDMDSSRKAMQGLRAIGVQLALDNFGTGYSSLGYLSNLPVDVLHIDRSYVNNVTTLADHATLVTTTIRFAHSLGLTVVAEGVEKKDQLHVLARLGCDMMQGFLFSKPVPPNELGDLLRQGQSLSGATEA